MHMDADADMVVGLQETNRKRASSQEHRGDSPKWWSGLPRTEVYPEST